MMMKQSKFILTSILIALNLYISAQNKEQETIKFSSSDNKVSIDVRGTDWEAAGNMKGIEIFISKKFNIGDDQAIVTVSKEENLLETVTLNEYAAGKIFLQQAVLGANVLSANDATINGFLAKSYEYTYFDSEGIAKKTSIYFVKKGNTAYQMTFTSNEELFDMHRVLYNEITNSFTLN